MPSTIPRGAIAVVPRATAPGVLGRTYAGYVEGLTPRPGAAPIVGSMAVLWSVAPAVAVMLFGLFGSGPAAANQGLHASPGVYALAVLGALPVLLWRWRPLWTLVGTGSVVAVYLALGFPYGPILISLDVGIFAYARTAPLRRILVAMGVLLAAGAALVTVGLVMGTRHVSEYVGVAVWLVLPAAIGVAVKARRDASTEVRAAQARRAVSEERLRLAQEVHDVAGHGFAVIAMQAGIALRVLERDPGGARSALEGIRTMSREALDSLRAEVEALRQSPAPLRPANGLADLPALTARMRSAGLPVTVDGAAGELRSDVDLAAYRIIQESLTNVLRHAGPAATARVALAHADGVLRIEVTDTGTGTAVGPGHGIDGMCARATALGGSLAAGPEPGGGFAVRAVLPGGAS